MTNQNIKAGLFQAQCSNDRDSNLDNITQAVASAHKQNLDLLVLPELHNGPYFCQNQVTQQFDRAETIPGHSTDYISKLAKKYNLVIVASIFEKTISGLYFNTAVVFDKNGEVAGKYRKMHIPHDPDYNEKYYFSPGYSDGVSNFSPINTSIGKLGVLVCWDQWFPEAARIMALQGANILIYPTAIGWSSKDDHAEQQRQLSAWQTVQRAHAVANNVFLISCNRTGREQEEYPYNPDKIKSIDFWGNSFIAGPQGEVLSSLQQETNAIISAELTLDRIEQIRRAWPFFRDRRVDEYQLLLKKFNIT
jgi:N-carbamoylputrescine amidase